MPISGRGSFDNTGNAYNVSMILKEDSTIDMDRYKAYSPLFIPYVSSNWCVIALF